MNFNEKELKDFLKEEVAALRAPYAPSESFPSAVPKDILDRIVQQINQRVENDHRSQFGRESVEVAVKNIMEMKRAARESAEGEQLPERVPRRRDETAIKMKLAEIEVLKSNLARLTSEEEQYHELLQEVEEVDLKDFNAQLAAVPERVSSLTGTLSELNQLLVDRPDLSRLLKRRRFEDELEESQNQGDRSSAWSLLFDLVRATKRPRTDDPAQVPKQ